MVLAFQTRFVLWCAAVSCAAAITMGLTATLSAAPIEAQAIADHFSAVKSMSGDFVQMDPRGQRTRGRFFLQRPGKIRFDYVGKSGISVIADGESLVVYNKKLKTSRLYPLSKTPLKLPLDDNVDLTGRRLKSLTDDGAEISIKLADRASFGKSDITMVFDRRSLDLHRWRVTDEKGLTTTVTISNVRQGVRIADGTFVIDYKANREFNTPGK